MKERIVGAFVLFCAGVLLWMVLFPDPSERKSVDRTTQIPPQMAVDKPSYTRPTRPEGIPEAKAIQQRYAEQKRADDEAAKQEQARKEALAKQASQKEPSKANSSTKASQSAAKTATSSKKAEPAPEKASTAKKQRPSANTTNSETGLPDAWVIQVATFGQRSNAESFTAKLQGAGYKAYFRRVDGKKGDLFQVLVGPKLSRSLAENEQAAIEKRFKVKTLISRFVR